MSESDRNIVMIWCPRFEIVLQLTDQYFPVLNRLVNFHFHLVAAGGDTKRGQINKLYKVSSGNAIPTM